MEDGDLGLHRIRMPAAVVSKGLAALRTTCQQDTVISDMCCASCKADHLSRGRRAVVSVWFPALRPNIGSSTKWVIEELHLSGDELRPKTDCVGPCRSSSSSGLCMAKSRVSSVGSLLAIGQIRLIFTCARVIVHVLRPRLLWDTLVLSMSKPSRRPEIRIDARI